MSSNLEGAVTKSEDAGPGDGFMVIKEGLASMYYDKNEEVFYNKVQVFNRDTSIQVIKLFGETFDQEKRLKYEKKMEKFKVDPTKFEHEPTAPTYGIHVLDALAATGLRSVRYVKEIPGVTKVTINDLLPAATAAAQITCDRNGVDPSKIAISTGDNLYPPQRVFCLLYIHFWLGVSLIAM